MFDSTGFLPPESGCLFVYQCLSSFDPPPRQGCNDFPLGHDVIR